MKLTQDCLCDWVNRKMLALCGGFKSTTSQRRTFIIPAFMPHVQLVEFKMNGEKQQTRVPHIIHK